MTQPATPAEIDNICTLYGFYLTFCRLDGKALFTRRSDKMQFVSHQCWTAEDWINALKSY